VPDVPVLYFISNKSTYGYMNFLINSHKDRFNFTLFKISVY